MSELEYLAMIIRIKAVICGWPFLDRVADLILLQEVKTDAERN